MNILKNKKGTEKPIEIFLALFIILAVSMVMLKMFKGQLADKTKEMDDANLEEKRQQAIDEANLICTGLCSDTVQNKCSPQTVAAYCGRRFEELDLNGDNTVNFDTQLLGGVGLCEDAVHCFHITTCKCGQELNAQYCKEKSCEYWTDVGLDADSILIDTFKPDSELCKASEGYDHNRAWNKNIINCS